MAAITNLYTIAAVQLNSTTIDQIISQSMKPGLSQMVLAGSGAVDPTFAAVATISPEFTFTTTAIKAALAAAGIDGLALTAGAVYFQKTTVGGLRAGASSHIKGTIAAGIAIPVRLTINHGQPASIEYRIILRSADGTTAPIAFAASQSLLSGQGAVAEAYTLGAVSINGAALNGVQSVTIDFGINPWVSGGDGLVYPTHVAVATRNPIVTISGYDLDQFVTMALDGAAQGATDSTIVLQSVSEGAIVGASPITLTVDEGMVYYEDITGSHGERLGGSVKLVPTYDGTNAIFVITGLT